MAALSPCIALAALVATLWLGACNRAPAPAANTASAAPATAPTSAAAVPAPGATPRIIEWDAARDGDPKVFDEGGVHITLHSRPAPDGRPQPVIHITAPGAPEFEYAGIAGLSTAGAHFAVGRFEPGAAMPQVLFTAYGGGAHCCTDVRIFTPSAQGWTTIEAGEWDGDGINAYPSDLNSDGAADFVMFDDRFDYSFGSHAESREPPRIFNLVSGQWTDRSTLAGFAPLFERDLAETRRDCETHSNPACAAYVADAARLGRFVEAWRFMLAHYNHDADWELPEGCRITPPGDQNCPEAQKITFTEFPAALQWFLKDLGYITDADIAAARG